MRDSVDTWGGECDECSLKSRSEPWGGFGRKMRIE